MNYRPHYERLIARARGRVLSGYVERHHVVPRCMGGGDERANLVDLTAEEHYVAHQLLVKMHPGNAKLVSAALPMSRKATGNKAYGWLRRRHAAAQSIAMRGKKLRLGKKHSAETRIKCGAANVGRVLSPEHRAKVSAAQMGNKRGAGRRMTQQEREHLSAFWKGKTLSAETRARISAAKVAYWAAWRAERAAR